MIEQDNEGTGTELDYTYYVLDDAGTAVADEDAPLTPGMEYIVEATFEQSELDPVVFRFTCEADGPTSISGRMLRPGAEALNLGGVKPTYTELSDMVEDVVRGTSPTTERHDSRVQTDAASLAAEHFEDALNFIEEEVMAPGIQLGTADTGALPGDAVARLPLTTTLAGYQPVVVTVYLTASGAYRCEGLNREQPFDSLTLLCLAAIRRARPAALPLLAAPPPTGNVEPDLPF